QQITETGKALAAVEQKRVEFEQRVGLLPGAGSISDRLMAARAELNQLEPQLAAAQSAVAAINGQLGGTPATIAGVGPGGAPSALAQAQAELAAARARGWTAEHPDVEALQRQIAAIKAQGGGNAVSTGGGTPNPAYLSLKSMQAERAANLQMLQGRRAQIQADINNMVSRQFSQPGLATEQERLSRDYDVLKNQYDKLLADREAVRLRGDVQNESTGMTFRVIDPPGVPGAPASPNRPLLLVGVLIAGVGAGVGAAFAMGQLRQTFPTAQKLAKAAGVPVIGSVTETLSPALMAEGRRRLQMFMGGCAALGGVCLLLIMVEFVQRGMA
ncbi:MAG: chain-length determining protein, partial [Sphingobium sp. 32-64-5]